MIIKNKAITNGDLTPFKASLMKRFALDKNTIAKCKKDVSTKGFLLPVIYEYSLNVIGFHQLWERGDSKTFKSLLETAFLAIASMYELKGGKKDDNITIEWEKGSSVTITNTGEALDDRAQHWYQAMIIALILRDKHKQRRLLNIPINQLLDQPAVEEHPLYYNNMVKFFHEVYFEGTPKEREEGLKIWFWFQQQDTTLTTNPFLYICEYQVATLLSLCLDDEEGFNRHLIEALKQHDEFWTSNLNWEGAPEEDLLNSLDPQGYVALPLTAMAAMAYDKGWKLTVESDYMPASMVDGSISK
ncbi:MAG: immunity 49 family protein [Bacteroidota bacterium]